MQPVLSDTYIDSNGDGVGDSGSYSNVRTDYNWKGQAVFQSWPRDDALNVGTTVPGTHTAYDALGRVTQVSQDSELGSLPTTTTYPSGAKQKVVDPAGHVTLSSYQVFDQPSYDAVIQVVAASGTPEAITQTIARDVYGNPTSITQSGSYGSESMAFTKHLYYDGYKRLCRTEEPETGSEIREYDAANNLIRSAAGLDIDSNGCGDALVQGNPWTVRTYDAMNRLLSVHYPSGANTSLAYDARGAITSAVSGTVAWSYQYNARGLLTKETLAAGGCCGSISYAYDPYGTVKTVTYPDGKQVDYAPDALGRPTRVGPWASGIHYFPEGDVHDYLAGNGMLYLAQKNDRHLLEDIDYDVNGTPVFSADLYYDANANLVQRDEIVSAGTRQKAFGYDALNRLVTATAEDGTTHQPLWSEAYSYDPINNLCSLDSDGLSTFVYDTHNLLTRIERADGTSLHTFGYDLQGNVTRKDATTLVFDPANRLTEVVGMASYLYDASGRRVKKTASAGGGITYYAYNQAGRLMYQLDDASGTATDYIYLGSKLLASVKRAAGETVLNPPASIDFDANPNNGSYTVSWAAVGDASYEMQESTDGGASWHAGASGASRSKAYSGRIGGTYYYRVRACQGDCSDWRTSAALGVRPAQPTVTVPTTLQTGSYTVSWSPRPPGTDAFDVEERKNSGAWTPIASGTTDTSISRPGTSDGSYPSRVSARNAYGSRGWALSGAVTVLHAPSGKPTITTPGTSATGSYTVSWTAVSGAATYQLQERKNSGGWTTIYSGSSRSKARSGQTNGAEYSYQARACNAADCGSWGTVKKTKIAIPPPVPTNVHAIDDFPNPKRETLTVVWNAVSGASRYEIKEEDTGEIYRTTTTSRLMESVDVPYMFAHTYAVRSCNPYACSAWVHVGLYTVPAPKYAPVVTTPSGSGTGSYTVSWSSVESAGTYKLQEKKNSGSWTTAYSGSGKSKAFSGKADATYSYRVQGCNGEGCGPWSSTKTVVVAHAPPAPTGAKVVEYFTAKIDGYKAQWNAVSGATRYEAKRNDTGASVYSGVATTFIMDTAFIPQMPEYYSFSVRACNAAACSGWTVGN
jgi:YD repeat-containing protein